MRLVVTEGVVIAGLAGARGAGARPWTERLVGSFAIPIEQPQHIDSAARLRRSSASSLFSCSSPACFRVCGRPWRRRASTCCACWDRKGAIPRLAGRRRCAAGSSARRSRAPRRFSPSRRCSRNPTATYRLPTSVSTKDRLIVAEFEPASHGYDVDRSKRYAQTLLTRVKALPGVADAALADRVPFFIGFDGRHGRVVHGCAVRTAARARASRRWPSALAISGRWASR